MVEFFNHRRQSFSKSIILKFIKNHSLLNRKLIFKIISSLGELSHFSLFSVISIPTQHSYTSCHRTVCPKLSFSLLLILVPANTHTLNTLPPVFSISQFFSSSSVPRHVCKHTQPNFATIIQGALTYSHKSGGLLSFLFVVVLFFWLLFMFVVFCILGTPLCVRPGSG